MKIRGAILVLAISLIAAPALAVHSGQEETDPSALSSGARQGWGKPNINARTNQSITDDSSFPQGRNAVKPIPQKVMTSTTRPKKAICVGADCGCTSAKSH